MTVPFYNHPLLPILQKPGFGPISSSQVPGRFKTILHGTSCTLQGLLFDGSKARGQTGDRTVPASCEAHLQLRDEKQERVTRLRKFAFHRINSQCFAHKEEQKFQKYLRDNSSPLPGIDSAFVLGLTQFCSSFSETVSH